MEVEVNKFSCITAVLLVMQFVLFFLLITLGFSLAKTLVATNNTPSFPSTTHVYLLTGFLSDLGITFQNIWPGFTYYIF